MCAIPARWGFSSKGDRQRFGKLLARLRRWGYLPYDFPSVKTLADEADRKLFRSITQCQSHVLRHLLKENSTSVRSLRDSSHNFILPLKENRNFISWHYTMLSAPRQSKLSVKTAGKTIVDKQYFIIN